MSSESDDTRPQTAMVRLLRQVDYRERRAKLIWSTRYRIAVISFMLLYYTLLVWMDLIPLHLAPLLVGLAGMLINSLAYLLFRIGWWREMLTYIVVLCDMAGITVLAYYSGGMASPFVLIYLLHVVATAVYGTGRMAGTMTFLGIVCYGLLGGALIGHILPPIPLGSTPPADLPTALCLWVGFSGVIGLVWLSSGFFAERLRLKETQLERLHHRLDRRIVEIQTLRRISNAVASTLHQQQLLERLGKILRQDLPLDLIRIYLLEEETQLSLLLSDPPGAPQKISDGLLPESTRQRRSSWLSETREVTLIFGEVTIDKSLLVPMVSEAHPVGLLIVGRPNAVPDLEGDLDFYRAIANQVAVGIEHTRTYEQTEADSQTDGLTGLYNYRFFTRRLHDELARAERFSRPLTLVLVDLDHFKQFNDTHGHLEGDYLLQEIAELLQNAIRHEKGDVAARHGGEEFALILPEADAQTGLIVAERLRASIHETRYRICQRFPDLQISASLGVATVTEDFCGAERLFELADAALYRAKADGRNCVKAG